MLLHLVHHAPEQLVFVLQLADQLLLSPSKLTQLPYLTARCKAQRQTAQSGKVDSTASMSYLLNKANCECLCAYVVNS